LIELARDLIRFFRRINHLTPVENLAHTLFAKSLRDLGQLENDASPVFRWNPGPEVEWKTLNHLLSDPFLPKRAVTLALENWPDEDWDWVRLRNRMDQQLSRLRRKLEKNNWPLTLHHGKHGIRLIPKQTPRLWIQKDSSEHPHLKWVSWVGEKPFAVKELAAALRVSKYVANKLLKKGEEKQFLRKVSNNQWVARKESA
jgi:hypothetical protein